MNCVICQWVNRTLYKVWNINRARAGSSVLLASSDGL